MATIEVDALPENLETVNDFLAEQLMGHPMKLLMQLNLVVEEIFINIANYAYKDKVGKTRISCDMDSENHLITIVFEDEGIPFNPLEREDPDVTASAEEREIGGLGIFLTKKMMDDVRYENKNGTNRLT
ncbi:MAG: ATP-binding protein, partial [Firmicutes bacterium]|nr:ATP-binding protein [Bacillota bacterium]